MSVFPRRFHGRRRCRVVRSLFKWRRQGERQKSKTLKACLHGGGGPKVGEVTRLGGVTRLSI